MMQLQKPVPGGLIGFQKQFEVSSEWYISNVAMCGTTSLACDYGLLHFISFSTLPESDYSQPHYSYEYYVRSEANFIEY